MAKLLACQGLAMAKRLVSQLVTHGDTTVFSQADVWYFPTLVCCGSNFEIIIILVIILVHVK